MEIVAHGLWATAAAITANRKTRLHLSLPWTAWWAIFPDVLAFGPPVVAGLALWATGEPTSSHHVPPRVHLGLPLYQIGHSLLVWSGVFAICAVLFRRRALPMLGWLSHILIDIGTHSYSYYATRFLWPVSNVSIDGIAWWTRWFWIATYIALAIVYFVLWRKGWLRRAAATRTEGSSSPAA
jgi:hypothetical protein